MSLKEYTELNQEKRKLWLDFVWTLKNLTDDGRSMSINNIIEVMRIRELAENLITDYWHTAKNEIRQGTQWNSLDQEQKDHLIKYWGYEKARKENNYLEIAEQLEKQSQTYLKEIELAKFHEERGKLKCPCYACEQSKTIHQEVQKKLKAETIWFWIDHQNCYLATSFFCDSSEKIKIGDLLSTREYVFNQKIKEIREQAEKRQASLDKVFQ